MSSNKQHLPYIISAFLIMANTQVMSQPDMTQVTQQSNVFAFNQHLKAASPQPGTIINAQNIGNYVDIIDAPLVTLISNADLSIEVGTPLSFMPHPNYIDASLKNNAVKLITTEHNSKLTNYTAGRPFLEKPDIHDKHVGEKLAWNMRYAFAGDNGVIPEMYWHYRDMRQNKLERVLEFSANKINFLHRINGNIPFNAKEAPNGIASAIYLIAKEPPDVAGTQLLMYTDEDDSKTEQAWMYVPLLRRVKRIATQQKTDAFLGSDIMLEDFLGYSGRIQDMSWSYKGKTQRLLPMYKHSDLQTTSTKKARKYDYHFTSFHGKSECYPNITWQLRDTYILEATPKRTNHPISKRRFYLDKQTLSATYGLIYDRTGALWKIAIGGVSHPDYHLPHNKGAGFPILDSSVMIDVQKQHCTTLQMVTIVNQQGNAKDFQPSTLSRRGR